MSQNAWTSSKQQPMDTCVVLGIAIRQRSLRISCTSKLCRLSSLNFGNGLISSSRGGPSRMPRVKFRIFPTWRASNSGHWEMICKMLESEEGTGQASSRRTRRFLKRGEVQEIDMCFILICVSFGVWFWNRLKVSAGESDSWSGKISSSSPFSIRVCSSGAGWEHIVFNEGVK